MIIRELAEILRARQRRLKILPETDLAVLDTTTDTAMIEAYVRCHCCGHMVVSGTALTALVWKAKDYDDFIRLLDEAGSVHGPSKIPVSRPRKGTGVVQFDFGSDDFGPDDPRQATEQAWMDNYGPGVEGQYFPDHRMLSRLAEGDISEISRCTDGSIGLAAWRAGNLVMIDGAHVHDFADWLEGLPGIPGNLNRHDDSIDIAIDAGILSAHLKTIEERRREFAPTSKEEVPT